MLSDNFYLGVIYVIIISLFMTLFELIFFTLYLVPMKSGSIRKKIQQLKDNLYPFKAPKPLLDYLTVAEKRESELNKNINDSSIVIISLEMIFFAIIIYVCYIRLKEKKPIFNILFLSILTVVILIIFQLVMYVYAGGFESENSYQYMTDNELKYLVSNQIREETALGNSATN